MKREGYVFWGLVVLALALNLADELLSMLALTVIVPGYLGYLAGVASR